jgi:CheY-like chemotaxis protein
MSAQLANIVPLLPEPAARGLILHVDDDDALRRSTAMLLRSAGFETREATCGEDALAQVEALRGRLDVLIVDYDLGAGLTGTEVAEDFARLLGHAVPTIMLTGDPANAEVPWLADAPVWVARKPMEAETLLAGLQPLVAFRRAVAAASRTG